MSKNPKVIEFEDEGNIYEILDTGYEIDKIEEVCVLKNGEWFDINAEENLLIKELYFVIKRMMS